MANLIGAALVFLALHRVVSGSRLRDTLISAIGEALYLRLFAIGSVAGLFWLGFAFTNIRARPQDADFWAVPGFVHWLQPAIQLIAFVFIACGLATANPGTVGQQHSLNRPEIVRGMLRITRHPFLWGVAIFAAGHLSVRSNVACWILFGTLMLVAVSGTASIDAKRRRQLGERWLNFSNQTSSIPFAAIVDGRQALNLAEIGWRPVLAGIAAWAVVLVAHPYLFGAATFP